MLYKNRKFIIVILSVIVLSALMLIASFFLYDQYRKYRQAANSSKANINISWFVFRDVNRNGIYDLEDRPYAGLRVLLKRPDGSIVSSVSNINGFTNFKMSSNPDHGVITSEGNYRFISDLADGWEVTSGKTSVEIGFRFLDQSPGGIVANTVLKPLGVAPIPGVRGQIQQAGTDHLIYATSSSGQRNNVRVNEDGVFQFTGEPGTWFLTAANQKTGIEQTRQVEIQYYPTVLSKSFFSAAPQLRRSANVTVSFDDLTTSESIYEIPNGYHGLNWKNWISTHNLFYKGAGYVNATLSSVYVAYNSSGHPATISSEKPFDFIGTYIGVAWPQASQGLVHVEGYRGSELVYEDSLKLVNSIAFYFHANYLNITRLKIYSDIYWQVILEDSQFRLDD